MTQTPEVRGRLAVSLGVAIALLLVLACVFMRTRQDSAILRQATPDEEGGVVTDICFLTRDKVALLCEPTSRPEGDASGYAIRVLDLKGAELRSVELDQGEPLFMVGPGAGDREVLAVTCRDESEGSLTLVIDLDTGKIVSLGKGTIAAGTSALGTPFSPSGDFVMAVHRPRNADGTREFQGIWVHDAKTGERVARLPLNRGNVGGPRWRDSRTIVWLERDTLEMQSYDMTPNEVRAGERLKLDGSELDDSEQVRLLSPDGSRLAVWQERAGELKVVVYDCSDGRLTASVRRSLPEDEMISTVTWSPDSDRLAVRLCPRKPESSALYAIYVANVSSGKVQKIRKPGWAIETVAWSPDGTHLAAIGYPHGMDMAHREVLLHRLR